MDYGQHKGRLAVLTVGALGVVFGDIGTSPLYAFGQCLGAVHARIDAASILGILSLIFWSLIFVVCIKYLTFIMRAHHEGEGGTLAMLALIHSKRPRPWSAPPDGLVLMVLLGSALLYGDGVITPAISVLSAVEGLQIAAPAMHSLIVPLSLIILVGLFLLQPRGTGQVGELFGPVMALWFLAIGALGVRGILQAPKVLQAVYPALGFQFLKQHGWEGMMVLGAVVLCFTGAEALFADLSHFGRAPVVVAWYGLVLPALVLNYFGQGAVALLHPSGMERPFFALVPGRLLYPMVVLATAATIIASQALISGTFTLTAQAIHMGYCPPFEMTRTSKEEQGQLYIRAVNFLLMAACIAIVLIFQSSRKLGTAYGLAVMGTMTMTSLTYYVVLRQVWNWPNVPAIGLVSLFLVVDLSFLAGNVVKIFSGAWVPLAIAVFVFAVFWVWTTVHARYHLALDEWAMPIARFHHHMQGWARRNIGTGVFLTTRPDSVPLIGKNPWLREHVRPEKVILITIILSNRPYVPAEDMLRISPIDPTFIHVEASFGFMQHPHVRRVLNVLEKKGFSFDRAKMVYYLPEAFVIDKGRWWRPLIHRMYNVLQCNSLSAAQYFRVPPEQLIHVGVRLEI